MIREVLVLFNIPLIAQNINFTEKYLIHQIKAIYLVSHTLPLNEDVFHNQNQFINSITLVKLQSAHKFEFFIVEKLYISMTGVMSVGVLF